MKIFLLALFIAGSTANPIPDDENIGEAVDVIVNGVPEGVPLDISDIIDIKVNQHIDGVLASATNVLYPYSAAGLAEAALAAAEEASADIIIPSPVDIIQDAIIPEPVLLPSPAVPEVVFPEVIVLEPVVLPPPAASEVVAPEGVIPEPVLLPSPAVPEVVAPEAIIPEPVLLPSPAIPEVVMPEAVQPEVVLEPFEIVPVPAPGVPQGEVYNDGTVQVSINTPQEEGVVATLQSWLNVVLNYFNNDVQTTQQIL